MANIEKVIDAFTGLDYGFGSRFMRRDWVSRRLFTHVQSVVDLRRVVESNPEFQNNLYIYI